MTETTQSNSLRSPRPGLAGWVRGRGRRPLTVIVILAVIIGAYVLGEQMSLRDLNNAKQLILQLQTEGQRFKEQTAEQNNKLLTLENTVGKLTATLNELVPSKDTYQLAGNQSLIVANGRLTVGLVGAPTNQGVTVNINGKQQTVTSGDVIEVVVNPSTTCHVRIQAFDMFQARVTATCP